MNKGPKKQFFFFILIISLLSMSVSAQPMPQVSGLTEAYIMIEDDSLINSSLIYEADLWYVETLEEIWKKYPDGTKIKYKDKTICYDDKGKEKKCEDKYKEKTLLNKNKNYKYHVGPNSDVFSLATVYNRPDLNISAIITQADGSSIEGDFWIDDDRFGANLTSNETKRYKIVFTLPVGVNDTRELSSYKYGWYEETQTGQYVRTFVDFSDLYKYKDYGYDDLVSSEGVIYMDANLTYEITGTNEQTLITVYFDAKKYLDPTIGTDSRGVFLSGDFNATSKSNVTSPSALADTTGNLVYYYTFDSPDMRDMTLGNYRSWQSGDGVHSSSNGIIGGSLDAGNTGMIPEMTDATYTDWTYNFWVKFDQGHNTSSSNYQFMVSSNPSSNTDYIKAEAGGSGTINWRGQNVELASSQNSFNANEWYMVTAVATPGSRKLYINGNLSNSDTTSSSFQFGCPSPTVACTKYGSRYDNLYDLIGNLDEVSFYDYNMSDSQVQQLYTLNYNKFSNKSSTYLELINNPNGDNTLNITASDVNVGSGDSILLKVGELDSWSGIDSSWTDSTLIYYNFDNSSGTTVKDISGNGRDGTYVNQAADTTAGYWRNGSTYDGSGDYVNYANINNLGITEEFSTVQWVNWSSSTNDVVWNVANQAFLWRSGSGLIQLYFNSGGFKIVDADATNTIDEWVHVATTFKKNGELKLYINGVLQQDVVSVTTWSPTVALHRLGDYNSHWMDGVIDEIGFFNKTLTEQEIKRHYANGLYKYNPTSGTAFSGNDSSESFTNTSEWIVPILEFNNANTSNSLSYVEADLTYTLSYVAPDTTPPSVTNLIETPTDPANYSIGGIYYFNATVTDSSGIDTVILTFDGANYSTTNIGSDYQANITGLTPGTYNYLWYANDTLGNINNTEGGTYTINSVPPTIQSLVFNATDNPLNTTDANLTIYAVANSSIGENVSLIYTWYINGTEDASTVLFDDNHLLAWLPFDNDWINYKTGEEYTRNGITSLTAGQINRTINFDGESGYINTSIDINSAVNPNVTITSWIYPTTNSTDFQHIWGNDDGGYDRALTLKDGEFHIFDGFDYDTNIEVAYNEWTMVTMIWSDSAVDFYINDTAVWNKGGSSETVTGSKLWIGASAYFGGDHFFNGSTDEVQVYSDELTSQEIASIYNAGYKGGYLTTSERTSSGQNWTISVQAVTPTANSSDQQVGYNITIEETNVIDVTNLLEFPTDPATYSPGANYQFNATITATKTINSVILTFDGANYSASNVGDVYYVNLTDLAAGTYNYLWYANDTLGNVNNSEGGTYTINQATTNLSLAITPSNNEVHGTQTTATGSNCPSQLTCTLYRDGMPVSNPDIQTLSPGTYVYVYNTTGNNNYTSDSITDNLTITASPVPNVTNLKEYPTDPVTYSPGAAYQFNATVTDDGTVDTVILTFDGINYSTSNVGNEYYVDLTDLAAGTYNYLWYANDTLGNVNNSEGGTYTINQVNTTLNITLSPHHSVTHGTQTTATGNNCPSQLNCTLYRDGTPVSNPDVQTLSKGTYTYVFNTTGNENYTADSVTAILDVTQGNPPEVTNLQELPADPATYSPGATYLMSATVTDSGSLDTIYLTFGGINYTTTNVGTNYTANITDLAAGTYNYLWFANKTSGAENHSEGGTYTVNRATGQCNITSNSPVTYPASVTVDAECTSTGLNLYRNGTTVTAENGIPIQLGAGTYEYVVNITTTQNYTNASNSTSVTVNQGTPSLNIVANPGFTVNQGSQSTVTGTGCPGELTCVLYRDGTPVTNPDIQTLAVGNYTYVYNTTGNNNYTTATDSAVLEVVPFTQPFNFSVQDVGENYARFAWDYENGTVTIEISADNITWMDINSSVFDGEVDQNAKAGIARELQKKMTYYVRASDDAGASYTYDSFRTTGETNLTGIILGIIAIALLFAIFGFFTTGMAMKVFGYGVAFIQATMLAFVIYLQELNQSLVGVLKINFYVVLILVFGVGMVALIKYTIKLMNVDDNSISEDIKWSDRK